MGRVPADVLDRVVRFGHRMIDVGEHLKKRGCSWRVVDQVIAAGTSVGANVFEADEALSRVDFSKCLGIATKELSETQFWLRIVTEREWIDVDRLSDLTDEALELRRLLGTMIARTRGGARNN